MSGQGFIEQLADALGAAFQNIHIDLTVRIELPDGSRVDPHKAFAEQFNKPPATAPAHPEPGAEGADRPEPSRGGDGNGTEQTEAETEFEPDDDPEVVGNLPGQPSPQAAAAYLQRALANWMRAEGLDHDQAAAEFGIPKHMLLRILQVHLPTENILRLICGRLPELRHDLLPLLKARRMEQNGVARYS